MVSNRSRKSSKSNKSSATKKKSNQSSSSSPPPTIITTGKETRQDNYHGSNKNNSRKTTTTDQRQGIADDYLEAGMPVANMDQLQHELKIQESVIHEKQVQTQKWNQILNAQRTNIDKEVQKWQAVLDDATRAHQVEYEEGVRKWKTVLADGIMARDARYEQERRVWQSRFDGASTIQEFRMVREEWHRLESSKSVPTEQMKEARERLSQLETNKNLPSGTMKEAQDMIDELVQKRDASTKQLAVAMKKLGTKKEKEYLKNVMEWQEALKDATDKHQKDCAKWEKALNDASNDSKQMKKVKCMLERLLVTREMPTEDMNEAIRMLDVLEKEEKDAHGIVMRHAGSTLYMLEEELLRFQGELEVTKKLIGKAVVEHQQGGKKDESIWKQALDVYKSTLPNSFDDDSFTYDDEGTLDGHENCYNWVCGGLEIANVR